MLWKFIPSTASKMTVFKQGKLNVIIMISFYQLRSWTEAALLPRFAGNFHRGMLWNPEKGLIYFFGGLETIAGDIKNIFVYDISSNTWTDATWPELTIKSTTLLATLVGPTPFAP